MDNVNLDALIPREDFEVQDEKQLPQLSQTIKISDLEEAAFFYTALRKPDFQRETSDWEPEKIVGFIQSFLDGDLIPAIILWNAGGFTFVIDGSHRLSALLAWVHDDYGDGFISQKFFGHDIDDEQKRISDKTRRLVKTKVGTYGDYQKSTRLPEDADPELLKRARKLGYLSIQLQWVSGGAEKAEASFFKINQQATPIDDTEIELLKARHKPHAVSARAIIRAGTGHKYWSQFPAQKQEEIESTAREINALLFTPPLKTPIKTLDLPLAGKGYSARSLSLVFDLIKITNNLVGANQPEDDLTGESTLQNLVEVRKQLRRLTGTHPSCLGLHPAVYFYSSRGRYQHTAFLALVYLIAGVVEHKQLPDFIKVRGVIEDFLVNHKHLVNQITYKYGSGLKGYRQLADLLKLVFVGYQQGDNEEAVLLRIFEKYSFLRKEISAEGSANKEFSTDTKSEVFLREALGKALRCTICNGYVHTSSITIDHIERRQEGGNNLAVNGQLTHPYCNSTIKG